MLLNDVPNSALRMFGRERARDVGAAGEPALQPLELRAVFGAEFLAKLKVALDPGDLGSSAMPVMPQRIATLSAVRGRMHMYKVKSGQNPTTKLG